MSPTWHCSHSMSVLAKADGAARDPVAAEIEWLTQELTYVERRLARVKEQFDFSVLASYWEPSENAEADDSSNRPIPRTDPCWRY